MNPSDASANFPLSPLPISISSSLNSLLIQTKPHPTSPMRLNLRRQSARKAIFAAAVSAVALSGASSSRFSWMDFITSFDIRLEKDVYYSGDTIVGCVVLENVEPIKIRSVRVFLRGRARVQLKILRSGESRTLKDDQYLLDDRCCCFGSEKNDDAEGAQILPRGLHQFNFSFQLPHCQMPCSIESKAGSIRYYVKCVIDIPFASSPQGIKYFSLIAPSIDCRDEKYLSPITGQDHKIRCLRCCSRGTIALRVVLERTAYCCGESLRMRAHIENHQDFRVTLCTRLYQHIEYRIERGLTETKSVVSMVLEHRSPSVAENTRAKFDTMPDHQIKLPVVPPTMVGVCRLMQIYYVLKAGPLFCVCIEDERKNETLNMEFPLTVATIPYRSSSSTVYSCTYDFCVDYVATGDFISSEFRLGQVYDGGENGEELEDIILYRPVYVRVVDKQKNLDRVSKELLDSSPPSLRGVHYRDGSQKSTVSQAADGANNTVVPAVNGDLSPRGRALEDSSNEVVQLY
ncbi:Arrestin domain-containing protein 2 [Aphelenchoides fujianensis]|nr:Arrestin domain-containing protein 2 [Aphelenchoides fujianensis]